jgi:transposase-like protein
MPVILLSLTRTHTTPDRRPKKCPYCGSEILQRWGRVSKPIQGGTGILAEIYRYRCETCKKTFRYYPEGIDRSCQTHSIRQLACLLYKLGLSYRNIAEIFKEEGLDLSHSTIWREDQGSSCQVEDGNPTESRGRFTIDKKYIHNVSSKFGVVVALDLGTDRYTILGTLNEYNPASVISWLRPLIKGTGIRATLLGTSTLDIIQLSTQSE